LKKAVAEFEGGDPRAGFDKLPDSAFIPVSLFLEAFPHLTEARVAEASKRSGLLLGSEVVGSRACTTVNVGSARTWLRSIGMLKAGRHVVVRDHTHPPAGAHAGPAPRNEYGEVLNLVPIPEAVRLLGISAGDVERLIRAGRVRAHGLARLVDPAEITHALSELRAPGQDVTDTPLSRPRPDGPQSERSPIA
jgi:hypothetical protein